MPVQKEPKNQQDLLEKNLKDHAKTRMTLHTERIRLPGIETLHLKPVDEVSAVLANVLKSRNSVTTLVFQVGQYIEITSESDLSV